MEISIIVIATSTSKVDIIYSTACLRFGFTNIGFKILLRFNYGWTIRSGSK